jgi:hypothetical protein
MNVPTEVMQQQEYAAALARIAAYREQLERADRQADQNSLDRAADLEVIYQAMHWVDEMPAPVHKVWRGRPVDPRSRNRFATWVLQQTGLKSTQVGQLHRAHELIGIISAAASVIPDGEYALRPFARLRKAGYGDRIPEVYKMAVQLADGHAPTSAETRQAVRDFLARYTSAQRRQATAAEALARRQQAIRAQFIVLLGADSELAGVTLNSLIDLYNEQVQK